MRPSNRRYNKASERANLRRRVVSWLVLLQVVIRTILHPLEHAEFREERRSMSLGEHDS